MLVYIVLAEYKLVSVYVIINKFTNFCNKSSRVNIK